ncbi:hypothetical protein HPB47_021103, partial [Ixodes persulcatus]
SRLLGSARMASKQDNKQSLSALEKKMMECTNLFEQSRGSSFAKQRHKQPAPSAKHTYPSGFEAPRPPRSSASSSSYVAHPPAWCEASRVPAFYREVERQVTVPGAGINGALVCSLLLSSGLSRPVLGRIWELCSCTLAGSFTPTELYTALALVAVAQAGHQPELELLSRLPQAPIPMFVQQTNNVHGSLQTHHQQQQQQQQQPQQQQQQQVNQTRHQPQLQQQQWVNQPQQKFAVTQPQQQQWVNQSQQKLAATQPHQQPLFLPTSSNNVTSYTMSTLASASISTALTTTTSALSSLPAFSKPAAATLQPSMELLGAISASSLDSLPGAGHRSQGGFGGPPVPTVSSVLSASSMSIVPVGHNRPLSVLPTQPSRHPLVTTGSGDFDDDFDDFKSATVPGVAPANMFDTSNHLEPTSLGVTNHAHRATQPHESGDNVVPSSHPPGATSFRQPAKPQSNTTQHATTKEHHFFQSAKSRKDSPLASVSTKPFQFSLKIDLNSFAAFNSTKADDCSKPTESKLSESKPTESKPAPKSKAALEVEDDFADFQQAFPETRGPAAASEDRYSAFKELSEDAMISWDSPDPVAPASSVVDGALQPVNAIDTGLETAEIWHNPLHDGGGSANNDEDEDFGEFCHVRVVEPAQTATPEKRAGSGLFGDTGPVGTSGAFSAVSTDTVSLGDGLSVYSLEFGVRDSSLSSRPGSVLSLDFRLGNSDDDESAKTGGSEDGAAAAQEEASETPASSDTTSDTQPEVAVSAGHPVSLLDKYSVIREGNQGATPVGEAASVDNWAWCLESVRELLLQAEAVFNKEASSQVCREALETEEGATYMRNMTEVYKVGQRIALSSRLTGMQSERLEQLCSEVQGIWERISSFLENSCLFTLEAPPVQDPKWLPDAESTAKACGVCLLHVDNPDIAPSKLSYSGREYHSPCANLWVNCVNSLLPAVTRPQLI